MRVRFAEPRPLPRVSGLTQDAFVRQYVAANRPVIVTDATNGRLASERGRSYFMAVGEARSLAYFSGEETPDRVAAS